MFTGIIQHVGIVRRLDNTSAGRRLWVEVGPLADRLTHGASLAVNGACLTEADRDGVVVGLDAVAETLRRTTLGRLSAGAKVNLEPALRVGDGLDGHIVQGHVDGLARLDRVDRSAGQWEMHFACDRSLTDEMVAKGSVAIDGVSLTLAALGDGRFAVAIIPTTLAETTLGDLSSGSEVNIETDVLGKYVRRMVGQMTNGGGVTMDKLRQAGFL